MLVIREQKDINIVSLGTTLNIATLWLFIIWEAMDACCAGKRLPCFDHHLNASSQSWQGLTPFRTQEVVKLDSLFLEHYTSLDKDRCLTLFSEPAGLTTLELEEFDPAEEEILFTHESESILV